MLIRVNTLAAEECFQETEHSDRCPQYRHSSDAGNWFPVLFRASAPNILASHFTCTIAIKLEIVIRSKYEPLESFLRKKPRSETKVSMSFRKFESVIGASLPASAHKYREWWSNQKDVSNRPQAKAWLSAGFTVDCVQQHTNSGPVVFRRS